LFPRSDIFLLHRLFQARSRGSVQTKTSGRRAHRNESGLLLLCSDWREPSGRFSWDIAEANRGVVITRAILAYCCRGDATFNYRNVAITRRHYKPISTTLVATLLSTCLSCAVTARRTSIYYFSTSSSVYRFCGFVYNYGQPRLVPQYVFE